MKNSLFVFQTVLQRGIFKHLFQAILFIFLEEEKREKAILQNLGLRKVDEKKKESISPTFYWRNCANILAQIKSLTLTASTKKLRVKLSYEKGARKMLVKLTQGRVSFMQISFSEYFMLC